MVFVGRNRRKPPRIFTSSRNRKERLAGAPTKKIQMKKQNLSQQLPPPVDAVKPADQEQGFGQAIRQFVSAQQAKANPTQQQQQQQWVTPMAAPIGQKVYDASRVQKGSINTEPCEKNRGQEAPIEQPRKNSMKKITKRCLATQTEFEFCVEKLALAAPLLEAKVTCCAQIPEQRTQRPGYRFSPISHDTAGCHPKRQNALGGELLAILFPNNIIIKK